MKEKWIGEWEQREGGRKYREGRMEGRLWLGCKINKNFMLKKA